jgi:hypothetical protein
MVEIFSQTKILIWWILRDISSLKSFRYIFSLKSLKRYFLPKNLRDPILVDLMSDILHGGCASKSYIMRDFHGEEEEAFRYQTYELGSITQGLDEEDLGKLLQHHS